MGKIENRRKVISQLLERNKEMSISELADYFKVTPTTLRKDISALEAQGLAYKNWGKVSLNPHMPKARYTMIQTPSPNYISEVKVLVKAAAKLVAPGDSIILDAGPAMSEFAKELLNIPRLSVFTNSLPVANLLADSSVYLQMPGGYLEPENYSLVGFIAEEFFGSRSDMVSKAFLATASVTNNLDFMAISPLQFGIKKQMIKAGQKVYMLFDSSKINAPGIYTFASAGDIDGIITTVDLKLFPEIEQKVLDAGIELIYADPHAQI